MRVVYVTHNAIGTALVRSQVLPYLRGLKGRGHVVRLVTFERGEPYPEAEWPRADWVGIAPRRGSSLFAKASDIARGVAVVFREARRCNADLLHARSYLPAGICWAVSRALGLPFVFDMRGFLGEEYVEAGHWTASDPRYRAVRVAERVLLRDAAAVVVLTEVAEQRLHAEPRYSGPLRDTPTVVVPCAVDLERFRPLPRSSPATLVYAGTLGAWYLLDEMLEVFVRARRRVPELRFLILNRGDHALVADALARRGLGSPEVLVRSADFAEMPEFLGSAAIGIALIRQVGSKSGSSPIKIAEYLASGLPVITNAGLGDTDRLISSARCGHVLPDFTESSLEAAAEAVADLLSDEDARRRARRLAEDEFDVVRGTARYDRLYAGISARRARS